MVKVQKGTTSLILNKPNTNIYIVWYAQGDDMIEVFRCAYVVLKHILDNKKIEKGEYDE